MNGLKSMSADHIRDMENEILRNSPRNRNKEGKYEGKNEDIKKYRGPASI